ncbi:MAG: TetR/AcrR family transcriptional regulator [Actinomycetota bacterium]
MTNSSPPLRRRAIPKQARATATVDKILDAGGTALSERGLQGFNTNLVAELAGVNVATLYHYFPDKNAVLLALFERDDLRRVTAISKALAELGTTPDLRAYLAELLSALVSFRLDHPEAIPLRRACRAVPELIEAEEASNRQMAYQIAVALRNRYPSLSAARARVAGEVITRMSATVLDFAAEQPRTAKSARRELEEVLYQYLMSFEQTAE